MKRETVFAIVLGILLGLGIGLFVLFQSRGGDDAKIIPVTGDSKTAKPVQTNVPANSVILQVKEPEDHIVTSSKEITIKGKAQKNSLIVIDSHVSNSIFKNEKEEFSETFPLALGENVISINAYSESSTPEEIVLTVYYVTE